MKTSIPLSLALKSGDLGRGIRLPGPAKSVYEVGQITRPCSFVNNRCTVWIYALFVMKLAAHHDPTKLELLTFRIIAGCEAGVLCVDYHEKPTADLLSDLPPPVPQNKARATANEMAPRADERHSVKSNGLLQNSTFQLPRLHVWLIYLYCQ